MRVKNLLLSFKYAFDGIWHCILYERNFRIHLVAALTIIFLAPYYHFTNNDMVKLMLAIFMVLIAEMVNTSLEELVNLITDTYHEKAKIVKDVAAGAVALAALCAVIVAGFLLWDLKVINTIWKDIFSSPFKILFVITYIILGIMFIFITKEKKRNV